MGKMLPAALALLPLPSAMLSTSRLLLRSFVLADVPKLLVTSSEEGMRRWIPDQVYRDEQHAEQVVRALMAFTELAP